MDDYLEHYGRLGMKWYQHRFGEVDSRAKYKTKATGDEFEYGVKNLKKSKSSNLEIWGKDKDHNVCYIIGLSGSGKSTTARTIAKETDNVIHLDLYTEKTSKEDRKLQDKDFNKYLDKNVPNWRDIPNYKFNDDNYWKLVDDFSDAIDKFGASQYPNKRVIAEGIQLSDGDFLGKKSSFYKDKPTIILQTSTLKSTKNSFSRDGRKFKNINEVKRYLQDVGIFNKRISDLEKVINGHKDKEWIYDFLLHVNM